MIDQTLTDEWLACFKEPDDFTHIFARLALTCGLPLGVDGDDARVKAVIARIEAEKDKPLTRSPRKQAEPHSDHDDERGTLG